MMRTCLLLMLLATTVHAETFVICAGVEKYDDTRISSLKHAVADAKSVAAAFRASGVARNQVTLLTSDAPQADRRPTRVAIITALQQVRQKARRGDKLIFFFAGHGIEEDGNQYLLTVDTRRDLIDATALPMDLVNRALKGLQASDVLFIVDACRNAPDAGRGDEGAQLTEGLIRGVRPRIIPANEDAKPELLATLLSCDVGQRAYEDPDAGHGVFTTYLLKGLAGEAATTNGPVELRQLAEYVTREVSDWAKRSNKEQTPRLVTEGDGDMVLLTPPPEPLVSVSFQRQPLSAVVELIAEQYGAQVVLGKGVDANATVSGHLENQPLGTVLKVLLLAVDMQVRRQGKIYIIEAPDAEAQPVQPPAAFEKPEGFDGPVITVAADGSGQYRTIAEAVKAASDGAVIRIGAGTYREALTEFWRRVALVGDTGATATVIQPVGPLRRGLFGVGADGCQFRGLTFDGAGQQASSFYVASSGNTFADCRFVGWIDQVIGVQVPGASATMLRCVIEGTMHWAVQVGGGAALQMDDCTLDSNDPGADATAQMLVNSGADVTLRRCRVTGAKAGLYVETLADLELDDCDLTSAARYAVMIGTDAGMVSVRNSRLTGNGTAIFRRPQRGMWRRDPATGEWKWGADAEKLPLPPQNAQVEVTGCDLRGNANGAVSGDWAGRLTLSGNTYDPGDATVPKETVSQTAGGVPFNGPKPPNWPDYLPWPIPGATNPELRFRVCEKDGMPQVLIPAGEFLMGSPDGEGKADEHPQRRVYVGAFWMDLHEVTVRQYGRFCDATGRDVDDEWRKWNTSDLHPVACVSSLVAAAYAQWVGRALPTEAQWEKAARGGTTTAYSWGDEWDESKANNGSGLTTVGSYPANGFGLCDMAGNVHEWCRDYYDESWYARMPSRDPVKSTGEHRVFRGGAWTDAPGWLRAAGRYKHNPAAREGDLGFRCCSPVEVPEQ